MSREKPNIVLINCDDMGYGDLGCYGSRVNRTPFLDGLAREGMRFTSCYTASPVCSPSRASLMTGCYPPRVGINRVLFPGEGYGLSGEEYTLPQMLKDAGYRTMIVGKWHCGDQEEFLPCRHGFDSYYGLPYSNDMGMQKGREDKEKYPPLPLLSDGQVIQEQPDQRGLTERYVERCISFIRENKDSPFFLYFAQMHVHLPLYAQDRFVAESENGDFGACMGEVDWSCAAIARELKRLGLYEDTLFIFTSDNGSRGDHGASNAPLKGAKFTTWEGGQRVPMIVSWPGHVPQGTVNNGIFCQIDFLPTFAALVGQKLGEKPIDGINQLSTFFDPEVCPRKDMAYFGPNRQGEEYGYFNAYRYGDWKLHFRYKDVTKSLYGPETEGLMLFNLSRDVGETQDVKDQYPQIVEELAKRTAVIREELGDQPSGQPGYACRPCGIVENPVTLTVYEEDHPYIVAMYDKDDVG